MYCHGHQIVLIVSILSLSYSKETSVSFYQDPITVSPSKERIQEKTDIGDTKVVTEENTYASDSSQITKESKKQTHSNEKKNDRGFSIYTILLYIWLAGVVILSFITLIMNRRLLLSI